MPEHTFGYQILEGWVSVFGGTQNFRYLNGSMLLILSQSSVASYNLLHSKYKYRYIFFESFVTGLLMADHQLLVSLVSLHHLVSKVASAAWLCCALAPW